MSAIEIRRVQSKRDLEQFIQFRYDLYRGNPYDVPNLHSDEVKTFSHDKNAAFKFCEAEYYMAFRDGKIVGRVAAIVNHRYNEQWNRKCVRFGWIDFIDDLEVSRALLEAVEDYGRSKHMTEIIGPLGFTDMDPEGMLIKGYDQLGTMATAYNYEYYPQHMERLGGWEKDNDYVEYKIYVPKDGVPEKMKKISEMVMKRYNLHIVKIKRKQVFGPEQYGQRVMEVINQTFGKLYGYSTMSQEQKDQYVQMYFPMLDLEMISIVEDWNTPDHKIVGVGLTIPSLARALQKCRNGRLLPFGWWHIIRALKFHKTEIVDLLLIGVLPEYRPKGANALLFYDLIPVYQRHGFKWGETHVEMETNLNVQSQWPYFEHELHKRRRCYKKAL